MIVVGAKSRVESLLTEMPQMGTRRFVATPRAVERGGRRFPEEGPVLAGEPSELLEAIARGDLGPGPGPGALARAPLTGVVSPVQSAVQRVALRPMSQG
jgi:hypothetical protein